MNFTTDAALDKIEELISNGLKVAKGSSNMMMTPAVVAAAGVMGIGLGGIALLNPVLAVVPVAKWLWQRKRKQDRLRQRKEALLQEAVKARDAVIAELTNSVSKAQSRIDQLKLANQALQATVAKLAEDLK